MSSDYWRDARKHQKRKRDEMTECPRCASKYLPATPPRYFTGEKCRACGEEITG